MRTFLLSAAVVLLSASAAHAEGWYSSVYGGWNQDDVLSAKGIDGQSGFVIGGTWGRKIPAIPGLRVEADVSFRQNEIDIFSVIGADHDTTALLVNGVYDFPVDWRVKPYVLAGVGFGHTELTFEDVALLRLENSGLAYQLGTGVNFAVADGVQAGVGYRWFQGPDINVLGTELSDGSNHSLVAQLTFSLD